MLSAEIIYDKIFGVGQIEGYNYITTPAVSEAFRRFNEELTVEQSEYFHTYVVDLAQKEAFVAGFNAAFKLVMSLESSRGTAI